VSDLIEKIAWEIAIKNVTWTGPNRDAARRLVAKEGGPKHRDYTAARAAVSVLRPLVVEACLSTKGYPTPHSEAVEALFDAALTQKSTSTT
jgi:hypothetical protein